MLHTLNRVTIYVFLLQSERIKADQSVYGTLITSAAKQKQFGYLTQLLKVCLN